jgi:hypothetical protein
LSTALPQQLTGKEKKFTGKEKKQPIWSCKINSRSRLGMENAVIYIISQTDLVQFQSQIAARGNITIYVESGGSIEVFTDASQYSKDLSNLFSFSFSL